MSDHDQLDAWIDAHFDEEVRFLQELVRVPTDTPPGTNAPHADKTAELIAAWGLDAEPSSRPPVPQSVGHGSLATSRPQRCCQMMVRMVNSLFRPPTADRRLATGDSSDELVLR